MPLSFIDGNEAISRAAIHAGCRFFAGYPITPATTIFQNMLSLLPAENGICLQGEDEIASIGFCIGASMGGLKAMTATSGPGISLFSEQISFAIGSEVPLVIVECAEAWAFYRLRHQRGRWRHPVLALGQQRGASGDCPCSF